MISIPNPRGVFYGWWIVCAGMVVQMLVGGLVLQSFSVYAAALRDHFGWSKTMLSAGFAMTRVETGLLGPIQGAVVDRFGAGMVTRVGVNIMGVGFILFSQIQSPWQFFAAYFFIAVGVSLAGFMTLTVAVVNWFQRRRALALGLLSTGFAIGGLLIPLVAISFESLGWRATAFISGVVTLIVGNVVVSFIRRRPEDYGLTVDGDPLVEIVGDGSALAPSLNDDFTAREALRTRAFWLLSLGHGSALLVVSAVMVHLVLHVNEKLGYSLTQAALIVALLTIMQLVGQLVGGYLGDRVNKRIIIVICMVGHMSALPLLAYATAFWMIIVFALLHGSAWGGRGPLMQAIRADYFGRSSFGTIVGFSSMIVMIGMMSGPIVAGATADATGGYEVGFTILALLAGLGSVFFILATPPRRPGEPRVVTTDGPTRKPEPAAFAGS